MTGYINISGIDAYSSVYQYPSDELLIINGVESPIRDVKIGDTVEVSFDSYEHIDGKFTLVCHTTTIVVKYIGFSQWKQTCFTGDCLVTTKYGHKYIKDLVVGDEILSSGGRYSTIKCILEMVVNNEVPMCQHSCGLKITPFHPVKTDLGWNFPNNLDIFTCQLMHVSSLFSIALHDCDNLIVNGIEAIGLGHHIENDAIAQHPYFGTDKIIEDILSISPSGYCVITPEQVKRNLLTGLIDSILG